MNNPKFDEFWGERHQPRRGSWGARSKASVVLVAMVALAFVGVRAVGLCCGSGSSPGTGEKTIRGGHQSRAGPATSQLSFTTLGGRTARLGSFSGHPTMLWFIVTGCASCGASIPTVAHHLQQLKAHEVHVVALDLYGDLSPRSQGPKELRKFATATAKGAFHDPSWTWGFASRALSYRYDPRGIPDAYFLIDRSGTVRYHDTIPLNTMPELLQHARHLET